MKLQEIPFALAAANATAIMWSLATAFVALLPNQAFKLMTYTTHLINVDMLMAHHKATVMGFVGGLVTWYLYAFVSAWLFACLYNKSVELAR